MSIHLRKINSTEIERMSKGGDKFAILFTLPCDNCSYCGGARSFISGLDSKISVVEFEADKEDSHRTCDQYSVSIVPTLIVFEGYRILEYIPGFLQNEEKYRKALCG